jgi:modulator of FtsH protease
VIDAYRPDIWHDFFVVTGSAAAALAGLVFVAVTLHLRAIAGHIGHRHRARTILASLGQILIASLIVLIPTLDHVGAGVALVIVTGWLLYATLKSTVQIAPVLRRWRGDPIARTIAIRTTIGDLSMVMGFGGAIGVVAGYGPGLSFVGADMVVRFGLAIAGAWLLIVAVSEEPPDIPTRP